MEEYRLEQQERLGVDHISYLENYEKQEAAKAAAAKEYAVKKGLMTEEEAEESAPKVMSGIPSRPYCKGRNYDPNRYASQNTEE